MLQICDLSIKSRYSSMHSKLKIPWDWGALILCLPAIGRVGSFKFVSASLWEGGALTFCLPAFRRVGSFNFVHASLWQARGALNLCVPAFERGEH